MNSKEFYKLIGDIIPDELAEDWDNCGIQIDSSNPHIEKVLITLEINQDIVDEALEKNVDVIITHHPLIFNPLSRITKEDPEGSYIFQLIKNNISVFSYHTNFDKLQGGNNDYLGNLLDIREIKSLPGSQNLGRMGITPFDTTVGEFILMASDVLEIDLKYMSLVGNKGDYVDKIGWCVGSGADFLKLGKEAGCQLFITGDVKYHQGQFAKALGIAVLDLGHYGTEKFFAENLAGMLRKFFKDIIFYESNIDINPFSVV